MDDGKLLDAEQAQARLGVSRATFWKLMARYNVPRYKVPVQGKRVYFKPEDLDRLNEPTLAQG